jgi:hypothetical protein
MTKYCIALLWVGLLSAGADTLSLRDGTSLGGRLISIDSAQIRFRVNGNILPYSRSAVAGIDFGPEPEETALSPVNGQTVDQVLSQFGAPEVIADGEEPIYIYGNWKVTFTGRQVASVETLNPGPRRITTGNTSRLELGQGPDEIVAVLGEPVNTVDLGQKKIYVFKDLKVTFQNAKATAFK